MSGKYRGLKANIRAIIPNVKWTHCCIYRESLAARQMPGKLKRTLDEAVKVVNIIKAHPLNSCIFSVLCEEMGNAHEQLLLHSQVRWLSRGKVLTRIFELRDEIRLFLHDKSFHGRVVQYMSDIFTYLNGLNLNLQGRSITIFKDEDKVEAMIMKLDLWSERLQSGVFESFPTLCDFLAVSDDDFSEEIRNLFIQHLQGLKNSFRDYFPLPDANNKWIRDPFHVDVKNVKDLTSNEQKSC
ncbi:zinc finger BED domain-containing protein 5-like [Limulus polyphemus]|uniref:Zinc finger BED domain-containing protein 5-like n=1 Tax=Limulus polyphemus TaxID=6850 RepID=A0ABM1BUA4_LIMPO|nr:zinc finger BED domain-containing protein 5-like [Limulus polyphemus]